MSSPATLAMFRMRGQFKRCPRNLLSSEKHCSAGTRKAVISKTLANQRRNKSRASIFLYLLYTCVIAKMLIGKPTSMKDRLTNIILLSVDELINHPFIQNAISIFGNDLINISSTIKDNPYGDY
ncbi:hypothetical protein H5410_059929 [Solanum commersonii]|uniref:Uncharacterized protein n=1 Tax=Solanum commersonii TaxID=4109 RepID=A0A9J5W3Q3_SOLCO|nr:hypothetical protein H5410_059929 [Solanum commersonii]